MIRMRDYTGWTFSAVQCKAGDRLMRIGLHTAVAYLNGHCTVQPNKPDMGLGLQEATVNPSPNGFKS